MRMKTAAIFAVISVCSLFNAHAQPAKPGKTTTISIERFDGASVVTDLGYNIALNKHSSLKRDDYVIKDESAPAFLKGPADFKISYKTGERYSSGQYLYGLNYVISPTEPITAFEVRVHVFDVFGRFMSTLSSTKLEDLTDPTVFTPTWRIFLESEASEAYASVTYIAQVRTASGKVYEIDRAAVLDQIRKVSKRIAEADLVPKNEKTTHP